MHLRVPITSAPGLVEACAGWCQVAGLPLWPAHPERLQPCALLQQPPSPGSEQQKQAAWFVWISKVWSVVPSPTCMASASDSSTSQKSANAHNSFGSAATGLACIDTIAA